MWAPAPEAEAAETGFYSDVNQLGDGSLLPAGLAGVGQGTAILEDINVIALSEFDTYVSQLGGRLAEDRR